MAEASSSVANSGGGGSYTEVIHEENAGRVNGTGSGGGEGVVSNEACSSSSSSPPTNAAHTLRIRLTKRASTNRRVSWTNDTIDNEFLNKKKSKCCCVYTRPKNFDESSSDDENEDKECQHCKGHRKTDYNSLKHQHSHDGTHVEHEHKPADENDGHQQQ